MVHIRSRHNKVVTRITDFVRFRPITTKLTVTDSGFQLRPDMVVEEDRTLITDVTCRCSFDNGPNSWVSRDVINFTGGQLQIDTLSSD